VQFLRFYDGPPGRDALRWMLLVVKRCAWEISGSRSHIAIAAGGRGDIAPYIREERWGPAELIERFEESGQVTKLIEALKPAEREALILLGLGYSYKEIAQMRGWSRRKVDRCVTEGRATVRRRLERGGEFVKPDPWRHMEILHPIDFNEALSNLQGMLGREVKVIVNDYGRFFGCGFEGTLERVETLPPDDKAVRLVLSHGGGFVLDPADVQAFVSRGSSDDQTWLEFRIACRPTITLESSRETR
jgi:hypothetical protein